MKNVNFGEIYACNFEKDRGSVQHGYRSVIVLQTNKFNEHSTTTIVAAITSSLKKEKYPTHIFIGEEYGLEKDSMIVLEQLRTVDISSLGKYIGKVTDNNKLSQIRGGMAFIFDKPINDKRIMNLCVNCMNEYRKSPDLIVRRINYFQRKSGKCECCSNEAGYYYAVYGRKYGKMISL